MNNIRLHVLKSGDGMNVVAALFLAAFGHEPGIADGGGKCE
jgi:hypothetical protein